VKKGITFKKYIVVYTTYCGIYCGIYLYTYKDIAVNTIRKGFLLLFEILRIFHANLQSNLVQYLRH
jgi:hypothetical protein